MMRLTNETRKKLAFKLGVAYKNKTITIKQYKRLFDFLVETKT